MAAWAKRSSLSDVDHHSLRGLPASSLTLSHHLTLWFLSSALISLRQCSATVPPLLAPNSRRSGREIQTPLLGTAITSSQEIFKDRVCDWGKACSQICSLFFSAVLHVCFRHTLDQEKKLQPLLITSFVLTPNTLFSHYSNWLWTCREEVTSWNINEKKRQRDVRNEHTGEAKWLN